MKFKVVEWLSFLKAFPPSWSHFFKLFALKLGIFEFSRVRLFILCRVCVCVCVCVCVFYKCVSVCVVCMSGWYIREIPWVTETNFPSVIFAQVIPETCLGKRAFGLWTLALSLKKRKKKRKEKYALWWPLCLENPEIPGISFTHGKLNLWENTPGNTWKNIFLLKKN